VIRSAAHDPLPIGQVPVGVVLGRELDARGWSQADFATVLGRPTQFVNEILNGKKELTRDSAAQIGAAFDQSPEFWLTLQDQYLLAEQGKDDHTRVKLEEVRLRARLNETAPIEMLKRRGFLHGSTPKALEAEILELFEIDSLEEEPAFSAAARRANKHEELSVLQRAWFACVRHQARHNPPTKRYSPPGLKKLARTLSHTLLTPQDFANLPERFRAVGVRVVFVDAFPNAKIDGGAMFVDGYPVIGLSGRGKRLDKVLFTLLHEIAHVFLAHVDADRYIVEDLDDSHASASKQEKDADDEAGGWVFPDGLPRVPARIGGPWVERVAAEIGVAPIVIIGRLQHDRRLDWRTTLAKNAPAVGDVLERWS
jgi:HTH-type transcriptional regulator/antitoxin HigA